MVKCEFHTNLEKLLETNKCSKNKLAQDLGITAATVSQWFTQGYLPNIGIAAQIAKYFEVSLDELCGLGTKVEKDQIITTDTILNQIIDLYHDLSMRGKYYLLEFTETLTWNPRFKKNREEREYATVKFD